MISVKRKTSEVCSDISEKLGVVLLLAYLPEYALFKAAYSVTMNIFRKILFYF